MIRRNAVTRPAVKRSLLFEGNPFRCQKTAADLKFSTLSYSTHTTATAHTDLLVFIIYFSTASTIGR